MLEKEIEVISEYVEHNKGGHWVCSCGHSACIHVVYRAKNHTSLDKITGEVSLPQWKLCTPWTLRNYMKQSVLTLGVVTEPHGLLSSASSGHSTPDRTGEPHRSRVRALALVLSRLILV